MMVEHTITYNDKVYTIPEPSIGLWVKLDLFKDILSEDKFVLKIIEESTGLKENDIMKADWFDIVQVANGLTEMLLEIKDKFHPEFEFKGQKYRFIDLPNLTFGEFIDIDAFLQKNEAERKSQLNFLMALLYREVGVDNKLVDYDGKGTQQRAEVFKELPVKYVNGAMSFFLRLEQTLQKPSLKFLFQLMMWRVKRNLRRQKKKVFQSIGDGLASLRPWQTKTSQK